MKKGAFFFALIVFELACQVSETTDGTIASADGGYDCCKGDAACDPYSETCFIADSILNPCNETISVCTTTASCILEDNGQYLSVQTPTRLSFIAQTEGPAEIKINFYFIDMLAPGSDTTISWYETNCSNIYEQNIVGIDMFRQIGSDHVWSVSRAVEQAGDHLITYITDSSTTLLLKVEIE